MECSLPLLFLILGILVLFLLWNQAIQLDAFRGSRIQRCGVDMAPCPFGDRCMNGFCRPEGTPVIMDKYPLPVVP